MVTLPHQGSIPLMVTSPQQDAIPPMLTPPHQGAIPPVITLPHQGAIPLMVTLPHQGAIPPIVMSPHQGAISRWLPLNWAYHTSYTLVTPNAECHLAEKFVVFPSLIEKLRIGMEGSQAFIMSPNVGGTLTFFLMAVLLFKKPVLAALLAAIFLLSLLWSRNYLQVSLRHFTGDSLASMEIADYGNVSIQQTQPRGTDLQSEINAVFDKIQKLIPNVQFTDFKRSSSGKNSKVFIINKRKQYCLGEDLVVLVEMYDHLGNRKTYGGDFIRSRLFSQKLGASVSGRVEDFHNGSYHIHFPLRWADDGGAKVSIRLWHPSEGIAALWRARHASPGIFGFEGKYEYLGKEATTTCGFRLDTKEEVCEYKDEFYEEVFYCIKQKDFHCESLTYMRAVKLDVSYLTAGERSLIDGSNVGVEMAQGLESIVVTDCKNHPPTSDRKCQTGMSSPIPSGYFYNNTWHPMYCNMAVYKTGDDYINCLQGKNLYFIGDSTLRQYMIEFVENMKILKYFRFQRQGWHLWEKTLLALNMDKGIYVSLKRHGFPLEGYMFYYFKDDMYASRQIDQCDGGKDKILVITIGHHFRQFPIKLLIRRAINIRRAVERLFLRSPETKVIIKTENTREVISPQEKRSDFHGHTHYLVLREVFQGTNVGFVDAWDMTLASSTEALHPEGYTLSNIMSMTFTFAC
ncbi:NXPE family member 1-like [Leptodactylus fuscus]|uniref:NXPE family member 1-like n=1 Tax=Leptodactylus fuscus TaxID=238119 RepID=UPI003F4E8CC0